VGFGVVTTSVGADSVSSTGGIAGCVAGGGVDSTAVDLPDALSLFRFPHHGGQHALRELVFVDGGG
jgi:hypothetical protein